MNDPLRYAPKLQECLKIEPVLSEAINKNAYILKELRRRNWWFQLDSFARYGFVIGLWGKNTTQEDATLLIMKPEILGGIKSEVKHWETRDYVEGTWRNEAVTQHESIETMVPFVVSRIQRALEIVSQEESSGIRNPVQPW